MLLLSLGLGLNVLVLCIYVFNLTCFWRDHFGNKAIFSLLGMSAFQCYPCHCKPLAFIVILLHFFHCNLYIILNGKYNLLTYRLYTSNISNSLPFFYTLSFSFSSPLLSTTHNTHTTLTFNLSI